MPVARGERLVAARRTPPAGGARSASASRITRSFDRLAARRVARGDRVAARRPSRPAGGCRGRRARGTTARRPVDVGHAGRGEPQHELAERRARSPRAATSRRERLEVGEERLVRRSSAAREARAPPPPSASFGLDPARVALRLAQRLLEVRLEPLGARAARRRRASGRRSSSSVQSGAPPSPQRRGQLVPAQRRASRHSLGHAGERADPRAHVGAALRVVRRARRAACAGSASARSAFARVELLDARARSGPGSPPTSFSASRRT